MNTTETLEDLNLTNPQESILTEEIKTELPPTAQEESTALDVEPSTKEEATTTEGGEPEEVKPPEKTPEELEAETLEKDRRNKYAKLESENYNLNLAFTQVVPNLAKDPQGTLIKLASDKNLYNRVQPYLANLHEDYTLNYNEFSKKVFSTLEEEAKVDPTKYESVRKADEAKSQATVNEQVEMLEQLIEVRTQIAQNIPEFKDLLKTNPQLGKQTFDHALNLAGTEYARQNSLYAQGLLETPPDADKLTRDVLYFLHPSWQSKKVDLINAKKETANNLKGVLKGTATSNNSAGVADDYSKLTDEAKTQYNELKTWYLGQGYTESEAKVKALTAVKN